MSPAIQGTSPTCHAVTEVLRAQPDWSLEHNTVAVRISGDRCDRGKQKSS
jgi:hypothetical protein